MTFNKDISPLDFSDDPPESRIQSRALEAIKPATVAGFSFIKRYGDMKGTKIKHFDYTPAQLNDSGEKWFVWFSYRSPDGKMKRFKKYEDLNRIKDLKEKRKYAQLLIKAIDHTLEGGYDPFSSPLTIVVKNWTLIQGLNFFKQKIPDMGIRSKTAQSYGSILKMITEGTTPLHNKNISEITKGNCQVVLYELKNLKKWGNVTYNNALTFGRLLFSFLIQHGVTDKNPFKLIKPLPETKTQNQPFDDKTFELIKSKASPDLLRFLMFLYHTGTRPNEARQLKYENILRDRKMLYVPGGISKGKKDGYVPLSDSFLNSFPEGEGLIFGVSRNYYTQKFASLKKRLKLQKNYTLYSIKHTRAVHLAQAGASPYSIMQLFRHHSLEMTMHYLRGLGITIDREAAEKGIRF